MIDKLTTILIALVIISITSITITMIVSVYEIPKEIIEIEPIEKQVDNNIESSVPILIEEDATYIITESLKGFDSIQGELMILTIDYWFMYDATNRSMDSFELTLSIFNEETSQYVNFEFINEIVTKDGLLTAYQPDLNAQVVLYYKENFDDSKIVIMDVYGVDMENTLYFLTTPIFLVETEIEKVENKVEDKEIIAGFTAEELIEIGKILLPLLI